MDICVVCGGQDYYVEAGYYYCTECQTQREDKREEVAEFRYDPSTRVTKRRIKTERKLIKKDEETNLGWTTWEKYNFIILGLTNELIMLGASSEIKMTVLQLWATYLGKIEAAFISTKYKSLPRLSQHYNKKDAQILYGYHKNKARKRKKCGSSMAQSTSGASSVISSATSEASTIRQINKRKKDWMDSEYNRYMKIFSDSDGDGISTTNQSLHSIVSSAHKSKKKRPMMNRQFNAHARKMAMKKKEMLQNLARGKERTALRKKLEKFPGGMADSQHLCLSKLWGILYIALRIHNEDIHLSDMLRFQKEGHLSHYKLEHLLPSDMEQADFKLPNSLEITHSMLSSTSSGLIKLLNVSKIPSPNLASLISRYCTELQLPNGIALYAERILAMTNPIFTVKENGVFHVIPNYEGKAMAILLVVLKILFGLDGVTETELSHTVDKINVTADERGLGARLFSFLEWQRYIECRKTVLMAEHYPTKFRYDPNSPTDSSNLYLDHLRFFKPREEEEEASTVKGVSKLLIATTDAMKQQIERLVEGAPPLKEVRRFEPSLTPLNSYLKELLNDPEKDLPSILRQDFTATKVGYITNPDLFKDMAEECDINLKIVDSSANFVEKIVPTFDCNMAVLTRNKKEFNASTEVVVSSNNSAEDKTNEKVEDDYLSYYHRKYPGKIHIDEKKKKIYEEVCKKNIFDKKKVTKEATDDFGFGFVLPNGRLFISDFSSDSDDSDDEVDKDAHFNVEKSILLSKYEKENPGEPVNNPWHQVDSRKACGEYVDSENELKDVKKCRGKTKTRKSKEICDCVMCYNTAEKEVSGKKSGKDIQIESEMIDLMEKRNGEQSGDEDEITFLGDNSQSQDSGSEPEISILSESINQENSKSKVESEITFRPFRDFWLRRVTGYKALTNSQFLEIFKNLPINYRWLLNEFSIMIGTDTKTLYHEVCRIESYIADVICKDQDPERPKKFYHSFCYRTNLRRKRASKLWLK